MEGQPDETARPARTIEVCQPPAWRVVGTAVRGVSHARTGLPCQDAQGYQILAGGMVLAVVADGAGTARYAEEGAQVAVSETRRAIEAALAEATPQDSQGWQALLRSTFSQVRSAVLQLAAEKGESPREFACTLAAAVVSAGGLAAGQIGDGAVVGLLEDGSLFTATRLQRGEYANETHFLVQEDALDQAVIEFHDRTFNGLAVMSDGLIRLALKMPVQEAHAPFFEPLFRFAVAAEDEDRAVEQLGVFLDSARVNERTDDDKALILAVRIDGKRGP